MSDVEPLGSFAARLLLAALEAPVPALSAAALSFYPSEADTLKKSGLIKPSGYEPSSIAWSDFSDTPVLLAWSEEKEAFGYFGEADGWVCVPHEEILCFSVDISAVATFLMSQIQDSPKPPNIIVADHLWELGSARLGRRPKRTPILFGRRLHDQTVWQSVENALRNRPSPVRRILLTSTSSILLPRSRQDCHLISLDDLVCAEGLTIDPGVLSRRLDGIPTTQASDPITILGDGKEVRFLGKTYCFPRGVRQREIICFLHKKYLEGQLWTSCEEIIEELELGPQTRIRDIFKKHPAWNHLLMQRNGLCGFCFPDVED